MKTPHLTFFCELDTNLLKALFALPDIVDLGQINASICLGLVDLSEGRAEVVRRLNQAGIPVIAWLILPKDQGYRLNLSNTYEAAAFYSDFKNWTARYQLNWAAVGFDIEPDFELMQEIVRLSSNRWKLLWKIIRRALTNPQFFRSVDAYRAFITQIHSDGYRVESYQFPFIVDERIVHSTFLQRALGIFNLPVDKEVLVVYTSYGRPNGPGLLWSYGRRAEALALGNTGSGGKNLSGTGLFDSHPLNWEEFSRDLRYAWVHTSDIYINNLEGCVRQGFLARLKQFEWDQPIIEPVEMALKVDNWRTALRSALWMIAHPLVILAGLVGLISFIIWMRRR